MQGWMLTTVLNVGQRGTGQSDQFGQGILGELQALSALANVAAKLLIKGGLLEERSHCRKERSADYG